MDIGPKVVELSEIFRMIGKLYVEKEMEVAARLREEKEHKEQLSQLLQEMMELRTSTQESREEMAKEDSSINP